MKVNGPQVKKHYLAEEVHYIICHKISKRIFFGDQMGGFVTASAVVTALFHRERTGVGQEVNASLYGSMIFAQSFLLNYWLIMGKAHPGASLPRLEQPNALINCYKCQDGKWVRLMGTHFERYWPGICEALDMEKEIEKDPGGDMNQDIDQMIAHDMVLVDVVVQGKTDIYYWTI